MHFYNVSFSFALLSSPPIQRYLIFARSAFEVCPRDAIMPGTNDMRTESSSFKAL